MGNNNSWVSLTRDRLDEYAVLTYLTRTEIISLFKKFYQIDPKKIDADYHHRLPCDLIQESFPALKFNPFCDRLFYVFSSKNDGRFSFEDMLDLCSVLSENCPDKVKAKWAFKIFDFNDDDEICTEDITTAIDKLLRGYCMQLEQKNYIAKTLLKQMDIQNSGSISQLEFEHAVGKMSDFAPMFTFSI